MGLLNGDTLCCHTGVIQAAMRKNTKRVHRLVVLPSFQGIGIGTSFIDFIAGIYGNLGYMFNLITTTPALRFALMKNDNWALKRSGKVRPPGSKKFLEKNGYSHLYNSFSCSRVTYSFIWKHTKEKTDDTSVRGSESKQLTLF